MACKEIRDQIRSTLNESRQLNRDKVLNSRRNATHDPSHFARIVTETEVNMIGNKLKTKSTVQIEDLNLLKISFVQNVNNIVTFLKLKGALHSLVRELSSGKSNYQLVATECFCNLGLGDAKSCMMVAKAASPYLIAHLSGCNYNLINASVWALGNLIGSDEKTWQIIHSQGFLGKLLKLIEEYDAPSDIQTNVEIQQNSLFALVQLLKTGTKVLTQEEVHLIAKTIGNLSNTSTKGLRVSEYLLSCMEAAEPELIANKVHIKCLQFLDKTVLSDESIASFTPALRTIGNLVAEPTGRCCLDIYANFNQLTDVAQKIFASSYKHLVQEIGWLLGNLMNHSSPEAQSVAEGFTPKFQVLESQFVFLNR